MARPSSTWCWPRGPRWTGRLSGQDDVVIGMPVANRMRTKVEPLIGFFVKTLALRIELSGRPESVGWWGACMKRRWPRRATRTFRWNR